jgi:hypothetical protein
VCVCVGLCLRAPNENIAESGSCYLYQYEAHTNALIRLGNRPRTHIYYKIVRPGKKRRKRNFLGIPLGIPLSKFHLSTHTKRPRANYCPSFRHGERGIPHRCLHQLDKAKKNEQQFVEQNISLTMSNKLCFAPFSARPVATSAVACFTERGHVSSLARQRQKRKENYENNHIHIGNNV